MKDDVILLCCYPENETKLNLLRDLLTEMRRTVNFPVLLASHLPMPKDVVEKVDYFIYEKDDFPSVDYHVHYHFTVPGEIEIKTQRRDSYHALSGWTSLKSSTTFLRNKFKRLHFFQYDTQVDFPKYIKMANRYLEEKKFVGSEYYLPWQNLHGIVGAFWSYDIWWFDDNMPEISSWDEWKSYARDGDSNLMGENWLHNYFTDHGLISDCYFLTPEESKTCIKNCDTQTVGNKEPGLKVCLSETIDHQLILFVHLYGGEGGLAFTVDQNGGIEPLSIEQGQLYWRVFPKEGYISVHSNGQSFRVDIDQEKEYTETVFRFNDNRLICLKQEEGFLKTGG